MREPRANFGITVRSRAISLRSWAFIRAAAAVVALLAAGCSHRMVASPGEHTVKMFPDQATYDKVAKMRSQGGPLGMLGGIGANLAAREVDDQTPVRIVSSNDEGSEVEVTEGPFKGVMGFVPKQNMN